jgi:hypothetical protein
MVPRAIVVVPRVVVVYVSSLIETTASSHWCLSSSLKVDQTWVLPALRPRMCYIMHSARVVKGGILWSYVTHVIIIVAPGTTSPGIIVPSATASSTT